MSSNDGDKPGVDQQNETASATVDSPNTLKSLIERVAARIPNSLSITGNIDSTENVQVDGELKGDLVCKGLVIISETSQVTGNIVAEEALIRGRVLGFIRADRVRLCATSHVEGDISYQTFGVEPGAYFKGKMDRLNTRTTAEQEPMVIRSVADTVEARPMRRAGGEIGLVKS
jgi:cytoskeletal protein CcmA (bactofilin family)